LDMAPSSPSPPQQSPGTVQRRQLGRGGAGSAQRQHDGGRALPPRPTLAQRPTRMPSSDRPALPTHTHWPHARVGPPARPGLTPEVTCSARRHVEIRRPPWRPAVIRHPPRSTRPPAKLGLPACNATPTHPLPASALGSRGPLTRTLPSCRPNTARRCVGVGNFGERFEMAKFNFYSGIML
jgi:hypothetical protein